METLKNKQKSDMLIGNLQFIVKNGGEKSPSDK